MKRILSAIITLTMLTALIFPASAANVPGIGDTISFGGHTWRVLSDDGLIISEYALEEIEESGVCYWKTSTGRKWCEDFAETFSKAELRAIVPTEDGDTVFFLSDGEALEYFADDADRIAFTSDGAPVDWALRTATISTVSFVWQVTADGVVGDSAHDALYNTFYARPAIRIDFSKLNVSEQREKKASHKTIKVDRNDAECPEITSPLTRGMMIYLLYKVEGSPAVCGANSFADVDSGAWYADAVTWAESVGIVIGYDNGLFGADDPITPEQMTLVLSRYADYKGAGER